MSKQPWHFGTPERDPAELAEESARRRAEEALERYARQPLSYNPINNRSRPSRRRRSRRPVYWSGRSPIRGGGGRPPASAPRSWNSSRFAARSWKQRFAPA